MNKFLFISLILALIGLASCSNGNSNSGSNYNVTVVPESSNVSDGLNLQAVGELVKKAKNAEELERLINQPNGINNLDLDHDGTVNYINVAEFQKNDSTKGFTLSTKSTTGSETELATILVEKTSPSVATVSVAGNPNIYYSNAYYSQPMSLGDAVLLSWLFYPHPLFYHPFYYPGYYPSYYSPYRSVGLSVYSSRTSNYTRTSTFTRSSSNNPIYSRTGGNSYSSSSVTNKAPLSNAQTSQKSFVQRDPTKSVSSGGFGSTAKSSSSSGGFGGSSKSSSSSSSSRSRR